MKLKHFIMGCSLSFITAGCHSISPASRGFTSVSRKPEDTKTRIVLPPESRYPIGVNPKLHFESQSSKFAGPDPASAILKSHEKARKHPEVAGFFNAAMVYDFEPHKLYQVYTAPLRVTDIVLEAGERITALSGGDTMRWEVTQTVSGSGLDSKTHVLIKPRQPELKTNLIILTDRRAYHLEAHSSSNDSYMASLSWHYPAPLVIFEQEEAEKSIDPMDGLKAESLNFNYHFVTEKKPNWMPTLAFDDGHKTYIQFDSSRQSRKAPGLFVLSGEGNSEVLNYRSLGDYYIIDCLVDVVELRLGAENPEIVGIERL